MSHVLLDFYIYSYLSMLASQRLTGIHSYNDMIMWQDWSLNKSSISDFWIEQTDNQALDRSIIIIIILQIKVHLALG